MATKKPEAKKATKPAEVKLGQDVIFHAETAEVAAKVVDFNEDGSVALMLFTRAGTQMKGSVIAGDTIGSYSTDKGTTWIPFYSKATADADDDNAAAVADVVSDEVYIGMFRDVRFQYTNAVEVLTVFDCQIALNCHKPTSKGPDGALLVDN